MRVPIILVSGVRSLKLRNTFRFCNFEVLRPETLDVLNAISHLRKVTDELELQFTLGTKDPRYKKGTQTQAITALNEEFNRLVDAEPFVNDII